MASVNKVMLERLYLEDRKSIPDVAAAIGVHPSTARYWLLKHGIKLRSRADGVRAASHKLGKHLAGKPRPFSDEHRASLSTSRRTAPAAGVSVKPNGYIEITRGTNKGRSQHSVVMEAHIGRLLLQNEVVHHVDGDRQNNSIENLQLMTRAEHTRLHRLEQLKRNKDGKR